MTPDPARASLEASLAALVARDYCVLTGRGAAAIYVALKALGQPPGKVILPAILCPSPANVVLYAGFEPLFCDIRLEDFAADVKSIEALLAKHADVVGIICVHLYGQPEDMDSLLALARGRGLFVVEDAAQSLGGADAGRPLGSMGDVSILSFGHTKIIDARWGGAALTNDPRLARRLRELERELPPCPSDIELRFDAYRRRYYEYKELAEADAGAHELYRALPRDFRDIYLFRFDDQWSEPIALRLTGLDDAVALRRRNAGLYAGALRHDLVHLPKPRGGGVPWRFSLLLPDALQQPVTRGLRSRGIDVSNWYPSLHRWYESAQDADLLVNALSFERRVVNLWVDEAKDAQYIGRTAAAMIETIEECRQRLAASETDA